MGGMVYGLSIVTTYNPCALQDKWLFCLFVWINVISPSLPPSSVGSTPCVSLYN